MYYAVVQFPQRSSHADWLPESVIHTKASSVHQRAKQIAVFPFAGSSILIHVGIFVHACVK